LRLFPYTGQFVLTTFQPEGDSVEILVLFAVTGWGDKEDKDRLY